jgi:hypothetical protein
LNIVGKRLMKADTDLLMQTRESKPPAIPPLSLRGAAAIDDHDMAPPFDVELDKPTPEYLEKYYWGIPHLDAVSWRCYLPILIEHALVNVASADSNTVEAFLASLRPPDRDPPRFASLTAEQRMKVIAMLDTLAFDETSQWKSQAMLALEEYWGPGALYQAPDDAKR